MKVDRPDPAYEHACMEAVRRVLLSKPKLDDRRVVTSVGLVVDREQRWIVAWYKWRGEPRVAKWCLYEDVFSGKMPPGEAEHPEGVADQMLVWVIGG